MGSTGNQQLPTKPPSRVGSRQAASRMQQAFSKSEETNEKRQTASRRNTSSALGVEKSITNADTQQPSVPKNALKKDESVDDLE